MVFLALVIPIGEKCPLWWSTASWPGAGLESSRELVFSPSPPQLGLLCSKQPTQLRMMSLAPAGSSRRVLCSSTEGLGVQDGQRSWDNSDKESRMLKGKRPGFLTRPWHSCPGVASQIEDLQPSPCPGVCCGGDLDKGHGNGQISSSRRVCPHTRSSPQRTSAVCIFFWRAGSMRKVVSTLVSRAGGLSDVEQCFSHGHDHRGYLEIVLTYRLQFSRSGVRPENLHF